MNSLFTEKTTVTKIDISIFKGLKVHYDSHTRCHSEASSHPSVASHCYYPTLPVHAEGDIWDDILKQMQRVHYCCPPPPPLPPAPQPYFLCQGNHGDEILREVTKSSASSPVQSAFRTAEHASRQHTHTHKNTERGAIWPSHIMRVINAS